MPKLQLSALSRRVACSDPSDGEEQRQILDRLTDILRSIDRTHNRDACDLLDGAILLTTYLTKLSDHGGAEVCGVVASLVKEAGRVLRDDGELAGATAAVQQPKPLEGMLLGEIMLRRGMIRQEDIDRAIALKRSDDAPIGELLVRIGAATARQVEDALAYQRDCRHLVEEIAERRIPSMGAGAAPPAVSEQEPKTLQLAESKPEGSGGLELRLVTEGLLGEVLVEGGIVTAEQVQEALVAQRVTGMRMGEALVDLGACSWDDVQRGIDLQRQRRGSRA